MTIVVSPDFPITQSVLNARRGEMGEGAVSAGAKKMGGMATNLVDTLTNLMQCAHARGIAKALKTATMHLEAELRGGAVSSREIKETVEWLHDGSCTKTTRSTARSSGAGSSAALRRRASSSTVTRCRQARSRREP